MRSCPLCEGGATKKRTNREGHRGALDSNRDVTGIGIPPGQKKGFRLFLRGLEGLKIRAFRRAKLEASRRSLRVRLEPPPPNSPRRMVGLCHAAGHAKSLLRSWLGTETLRTALGGARARGLLCFALARTTLLCVAAIKQAQHGSASVAHLSCTLRVS